MASDGQVTLGNAVMKSGAAKVKRAGKGRVLVGFAGGAADGLALFTRFEAKLEERAVLTRAHMDAMRARLTAEYLEQAKRVIAEPQPDGATVFDHVFAAGGGR